MAKAEQQLRSALDRVDTRLDRYGHEAEGKIHALQEQANKAGVETKGRIEQRVTALRADHERHKVKLGQARKLAQEALKPETHTRRALPAAPRRPSPTQTRS